MPCATAATPPASGIGREVAADGAGAFRRQELRIEPVGLGRGLARALQRHAGFHRHRVGDGVDLAHLVEPVEREHDFVVMRDLASDEAGVAALRHDRRLRLVGEFDDLRHLFDRARP
jgi:hypothetical protein